MKKNLHFRTAVLLLILPLVLFLINGCGKKEGDTPTTGGKGGSSLLSYFPENTSGVILVNVDKLSKLDLFNEMTQKKDNAPSGDEMFKDYNDFVAKTGVDPKKDIHSVAVGVFGQLSDKEPNFAALINVDCDQSKVLSLIKEKGGEISDEVYKELAIYSGKSKGNDVSFSFLDSALMAFGKSPNIKQVIDMKKGGGSNVMNNKALAPHLKKMKGKRIASFAFVVPEKMKKDMGADSGGMVSADLTKAEAICGYFDHKGGAWEGELVLISKDTDANEKMVTSLNGLKGMGAMGGPEVAELLNNVNLTASGEEVKLSFKITDELVNKLKAKAGQKMGAKMGQQ